MGEMVERVARAIAGSDGWVWEGLNPIRQHAYRENFSAAIRTLRDHPTEAMLLAAARCEPCEVWHAMLDAALGE